MNEQELELQLSQYNKKLNLYDTIYRKTPIWFIRNSVAKKIIRVRDRRDKCFKDLFKFSSEKFSINCKCLITWLDLNLRLLSC